MIGCLWLVHAYATSVLLKPHCCWWGVKDWWLADGNIICCGKIFWGKWSIVWESVVFRVCKWNFSYIWIHKWIIYDKHACVFDYIYIHFEYYLSSHTLIFISNWGRMMLPLMLGMPYFYECNLCSVILHSLYCCCCCCCCQEYFILSNYSCRGRWAWDKVRVNCKYVNSSINVYGNSEIYTFKLNGSVYVCCQNII